MGVSSDDAEQATSGAVDLSSSDLELVTESTVQTVGIRFPNIVVPKNAVITNAYIQFKVDEATSGATSLRVEGQAAAAPLTFTTSTNNVSARPRTTTFASWAPAAWPTVGAITVAQRTPTIANVIQELVNQPTWVSGNPLVIIITGSGARVAESFDGDSAGAPLLHIEYGAPSGATTTSTTTTTTLAPPTTTSTSATTSTTTSSTTTTLAGGATTLNIRVAASADDAEQAANGAIDLTSSDLELVQESTTQVVGMRFAGVTIPPHATIDAAYVQFLVDEVSTAATSLRIDGQATAQALPFTTTTSNISSRPRTTAFVNWTPASWPTVGAAGVDQRTPTLVPIIQELVNRAGWASGNSMALIVTGSGKRVAKSFDGQASGAPLLHVEYH